MPLDHRDAFTLLVAVLLSAQCTDKRVNLVTPHLWALADTPEKMSRVPVAEIQRVIRPCGLSPQKAKVLQEDARAAGVPLTLLGEAVAGAGPPRFIGADGAPMVFARGSFSHF